MLSGMRRKDSATIIKTYGGATYSSALCANLGKPHCLRVPSMTALAFWSEIPPSLFWPFGAGQFRQAHNQHPCFISAPSSQDLQPLFKLRLLSIYGSLIKQNYAVSHRRTCILLESATNWEIDKITVLMIHNQSRPYEELIGWYFIWEIPLQCRANTLGIQYAPFISSFQKPVFNWARDYEKCNANDQKAWPTQPL